MLQKQVVESKKAPQPIGPYSVGIRAGDLVFTAGQIGIDPEQSEIVDGGIEAETHQVLRNLKNILEAAGSTLEEVIKTTVFLRDMDDFPRMNAVYGEYFNQSPPARSTVQVAALPKGASVEIEAVAIVR